MDKIWDRKILRSLEVIGRCGRDGPRRTDKSRTLKNTIAVEWDFLYFTLLRGHSVFSSLQQLPNDLRLRSSRIV